MTTEPQKWPHTLKAGCKAFIDTTFNGLVPCKVLKITSIPDRLLGRNRVEATVEVTEDHGAYKKGMTETHSASDIIPCGAIHRKQYSSTILPYNIEVTPC